MGHQPSQCSLLWSGVIVQGLCMHVKGLVFATAFSPLMMIIMAIMGSIILSENIFLGSVLGVVLIAIGLYAILWGKVKDSKISMDKNSTKVLSNSQVMLPENKNKSDDIEATSNKLMCKGPQAHQFDTGDTAISITKNNNPKM